MSADILLDVRQLSARYTACVAVVNVNLVVCRGETVALCGPNKAGKSSLCGAIAGIVPQTSGSIFFAGEDISRLPPEERLHRGVSLCPEGRGIYPTMSVHENLLIAGHRLRLEERENRILDVLRVFGRLRERLRQPAGTLSGGEAQMLGIARRLVSQPKLLMVDEPSLGLAPKAIAVVWETLRRLQSERGTALVVVEEGLPRIRGQVDRAYLLSRGAVAASGTVLELMDHPEMAHVFTGRVGNHG